MTNTLFAAFGMLAPMHGLLRRFASSHFSATRPVSVRRSLSSPALSPLAGRPAAVSMRPAVPASGYPASRLSTRARSRVNTPLRVVRVMEGGQTGAHGGRMMISGRMADVCAELDRMAAREAALHAGA